MYVRIHMYSFIRSLFKNTKSKSKSFLILIFGVLCVSMFNVQRLIVIAALLSLIGDQGWWWGCEWYDGVNLLEVHKFKISNAKAQLFPKCCINSQFACMNMHRHRHLMHYTNYLTNCFCVSVQVQAIVCMFFFFFFLFSYSFYSHYYYTFIT